jgi:2-C-methyl-D-erythritol 4-phosphate cytidylyltransferase/2-C-methyl-D-erythritol 2,4-cyclodiphosphate synthase
MERGTGGGVNALLLLLGGSGERFGGDVPKQFLATEFHSQKLPLFEITARKLLSALPIDIVIFVSPENPAIPTAIGRLTADFPQSRLFHTSAGATRYGSFKQGWAAVEKISGVERLLVHDANRPYLNAEFLQRVKFHLQDLSADMPAFIPVAPVVDSIVRVDSEHVARYEDRQELKRVQTPQLIHYPTFSERFAAAIDRGQLAFDFTDEGSLCLSLGMPVGNFEGDVENVKITFAADLDVTKLSPLP